jgi:hypothetical protein
MKLSRRRKSYYILLFIFLTLLIGSYGNIARGGAILWGGLNLFYLAIFLAAASLFYIIASSQTDSFSFVEAFAVGAFCLSLLLILWVGSGQLPNDPDSIISMHSISYVLENGFSAAQIGDPTFLIFATYSLPMQSLLGAILVLVTNASFITVAKYLPLLIVIVLLIVYYALVSTHYSKRASLLSLAALTSFPIFLSFANVFNNVVLGSMFLFLTLLLISMRNSHNRTLLTALAFVVICSFVLTHHLTFMILLVVLAVLTFKDVLVGRTRANTYVRAERVNIVFLLALVAALAYYSFVYFGPLRTIIGTFTNQLAVEVAAPTSVSQWAPAIVIQRAGYVLFGCFLIGLCIFAARSDLKRFLSRYADFLVLGGVLLIVSVAGAFIGSPASWDRISIYGWALVIPVTVAILLETNNFKKKTFFAIGAIVVATFILCNVLAIPSIWLDHSGTNEYTGGSYKDFTKMQELNAATWEVQYKTPNSKVFGDEIARRLVLTNYPNFRGPFSFFSALNKTQTGSVIFIRNEDSIHAIPNFYQAKGTNVTLSSAAQIALYTDALNSNYLDRVYDDAEVQIMYTP